MTTKPKLLDSFIRWMVRKNIGIRFRFLRFLKHHQPYYLIQARSKHGVLLNLDPGDYVDSIVLRDGYYEEEVLATLLKHLAPDGVFWDVGANIGLHALTINHLRPDSKVICFEPSPFTFSRLYLNANLNNADVILLNVGLGDVNGYLKLSLSISNNSGLTSFKPWGNIAYKHSMLCYCEVAAKLVAQGVAPMPTVVKVDVEGFEYEVLSGFQELLRNQTLRAVVFESPNDFISNSDKYPAYKLLLDAGFEVSAIQPTKIDDTSPPTNFVAKRPNG